MTAYWIKGLALLFFLSLLMMLSSVLAQEGGDKLVVHIRAGAVTLNHAALKDKVLGQRVAALLEKVVGVTRPRMLLASGMVEARFDNQKLLESRSQMRPRRFWKRSSLDEK